MGTDFTVADKLGFPIGFLKSIILNMQVGLMMSNRIEMQKRPLVV